MRLLLGLTILSQLAFQLITVPVFAGVDGVPEDRQSRKVIREQRAEIKRNFSTSTDLHQLTLFDQDAILAQLPPVDPIVPRDLLAQAVDYLNSHRSKFKNQNYISIIDFAKPSDRARLFIVDLKTGAVSAYHTTHGLNSDPNDTGYATLFGNERESGKTSIGFFKTAETYTGSFGPSMRIDGLSSTNSNVRARAIVFHASAGTFERDVKQERSYGCFTLDATVRDAIIKKMKGGSLLYADVSKNP